MKNKKLLTLALAGAMTLSLAAPALAADLPEDWKPADGARTAAPWYAEAVDYVQDKGLMTGTGNGFEPEAVLTAASVLQTLYNKEGRPDAAQETDPWYADAAAWAKKNGIAELTEDADAARGDVKAMLDAYCAMKYVEGDTLMKGNENGDMMLDKTLTRAEFATILMRLDALEPYATAATVFIDVDEQDKIPAHTIPAIVTLPTAEGTFPAVVMLHGTGSNKHEAGGGYDMAAPAMAKVGIATIRFDFMGIDESEASYTDYCFTSANIDAKAAADYIGALKKVDGDKLAVMGWSQGGTNALLAAAAYPETFKAVITWAGSVTSKTDSDSFKEQYAIAKKDGFYVQEYDWREPLHVGLRWYEENMKFDKLAETAKIKAPILAIQGLKDTSVLPENADKIVAASKNEATRAYYIEDCDHTFNVFSGDYTAINEAIYAGIGFVKEVFGQELTVTGKVIEVEKYGHAKMDIRKDTMAALGFELGDVVTVTAGTYTGDMPYFDGYYVDSGEYMLRGYPSHDTVGVCINYGKFCEVAGIGVGDEVTITLKEKGGAATTQAVYSLIYTNDRADYDSDEVFANFREITLGEIGKGKLYRSASPINNENGRAAITDDLVEKVGVKAVMNLADTAEEMAEYTAAEGFDSPYYKGLYDGGKVIVLGMPVNFASDEFAAGIVKGLTFLSENEGPYLVHCTEGKDRAGFTAALLEALMGAKLEEIEDDYLQSYVNYYHLDPKADAEKCQMIVEKNVHEMLRAIAGLEKGAELKGVDLAKAAETYLTGHGMTAEALTALKANLKG